MNGLLVVFGLHNELAASLNDVIGCLTLSVQSIGRDEGIAQVRF